jgi:hypothetical protein
MVLDQAQKLLNFYQKIYDLDPDNEGIMLLPNTRNHSPADKDQHPRRL